jgi:tetratricopeptide (TPR) repeat protein
MDRNKLTRAAVIAFCASVAPIGAPRVMADAASHPPPPPLLLLYPATPGNSDDIHALASVRTSLREKSYFDVITYDVDAPAVIRAANENHHQEWVDHGVDSDDQRLALAHAMGADYYAVITHGGRDRKADVRMVAVNDSTRVWSAHDRSEREASQLQDDATAYVSEPKPATVASAPTAPASAAVATPTPSTPAPAAATPPPSTPAPVAVAPPMASTPVPVVVAPTPSTPPSVATVPAPAAPLTPSPTTPVDAHPVPPVSVPPAPEVAPTTPSPVAIATAKTPPSDKSTTTNSNAPVIVNEPSTAPASAQTPPSPQRPAAPATVTAAPGVPVHVESVKVQPFAPTATDTGHAPDAAVSPTPTPPVVATVPAEPTTPPSTVHPTAPTDAAPATSTGDEQEPSAEASSTGTSTPPSAPSSSVATSASSSSLNADPAEMEQRLDAVRPLIARGDEAVESGEIARAISLYRQAIDGAPLSVVPRLKLAQAYLQGGFRDKALSEAKRALQVSPDSIPVQEFLIHLDSDDNTSEGAVAMYEGLVEKNPNDPGVHIGLGDAYWNDNDLGRAESEYKIGLHLSKPGETKAAVQLARLYAAQSRYDDALKALGNMSETNRYSIEISLIQSRTETLITTLSTAREAFDAGKSSHEDFYDSAKKVSADAGALADFVGKITPPVEFRISHLHRQLAVNLIGQEADVLQKFIETSDSDLEEQAAKFEKSAETEMLTAHAAEQKHGLSHEAASGQ